MFALFYVISIALLDVTIRSIQKERDRAWAVALLGSVVGSIVIGIFAPVQIPEWNAYVLTLLLSSGILWSGMVYCDFKAFEYADAVSNELLGTLRTVLLGVIGVIFFNERFTTEDLLGFFLIVTGISIALPWSTFKQSGAIYLRLTSIILGISAVTIDKLLVIVSSLNFVILAGYVLPTFIYLFFKPKNWRKELQFENRLVSIKCAFAIAVYVISGPCLVTSFGAGEIGNTFFVVQSKTIFVLIFAALLLKERDRLALKSIGALLSICGVSLVIYS